MTEPNKTLVRLAAPLRPIPGGDGAAWLPRAAVVTFVSAENVELARLRGEVVAPDVVSVEGAVPQGAVRCHLRPAGAGVPFGYTDVPLAKPGRVYGIEKGKPGERFGGGYRFFLHTGAKLGKAFRVEFDDDADEGMATVWLYVCDESGEPLIDPVANRAWVVTGRTWVRAVPPGQPDPTPAPEAVLWRNGDGKIIRLDRDPLPDEALLELAAMGASVRTESRTE